MAKKRHTPEQIVARSREVVEKILEPLDLIHALTSQIPDPGQHMVRYYGWYSNRSRGGAHRWRPEGAPPGDVTDPG